MPQKVLLVTAKLDGAAVGLDVLNEHLRGGWRLVELRPMGGGTAPGFASLALVERRDAEAAVLEAAVMEEEIEGEIEELLVGDGDLGVEPPVPSVPPTPPEGR